MALVFARRYRTPYSTRYSLKIPEEQGSAGASPSHGKVVGSYKWLMQQVSVERDE